MRRMNTCVRLIGAAMLLLLSRAGRADGPQDQQLEHEPLGGRSRFYAGFAAGIGDGRWTVDGKSVSWGDIPGIGSPIAPSIALRVGLTLSPTVLVWTEVLAVGRYGGAAVGLGGGAASTERKAAVNHFSLGMTWYPWVRGAFIRGGAGLAEAFEEYHTAQLESVPRTFGFGLTGGAGWAFLLVDHVALVLEGDLLKGFYGEAPGRPSSSLAWATMVGLEWQ